MSTKHAAATKILNQYTTFIVEESGAVTQGHKEKVLIETGGELRLGIELRPYISSSGVSLGDHARTYIENNRIYGRDPDVLKGHRDTLYRKYQALIQTQKREKIIVIHLETQFRGENSTNARFSFIDHHSVVAMTVVVCYKVDGRYFKSSEHEDSSKSAYGMQSIRTPSGVEIPFTPEAFAAINSVIESLKSASFKLREILGRDDLPALLNSGTPLLSGPQK